MENKPKEKSTKPVKEAPKPTPSPFKSILEAIDTEAGYYRI
jgi:hypothetical protein